MNVEFGRVLKTGPEIRDTLDSGGAEANLTPLLATYSANGSRHGHKLGYVSRFLAHKMITKREKGPFLIVSCGGATNSHPRTIKLLRRRRLPGKKFLQIQTQCEINRFIIFNGLGEGELRTDFRVQEAIKDTANRLGRNVVVDHIDIADSGDLLTKLDEIHELCRYGAKPLLHFDIHGHRHNGLELADGSTLRWERFAEYLRKINVRTENNLAAILGTCHGLRIINALEIRMATPFAYFIAPKRDINAGKILDSLVPFYQSLIESEDFRTAQGMLTRDFEVYDASSFFVLLMAKYFKKYCMGKRKRERIEDLITRLRFQGMPITEQSLKRARAMARSQIRPTKTMFEDYAKRFLIDENKAGCTYEDLCDLIYTQPR